MCSPALKGVDKSSQRIRFHYNSNINTKDSLRVPKWHAKISHITQMETLSVFNVKDLSYLKTEEEEKEDAEEDDEEDDDDDDEVTERYYL